MAAEPTRNSVHLDSLRPLSRLAARVMSGLPMLAALAVFLCHGPAAAQSTQKAPDVILISIDTLRADYVGCYGSRRAPTPNIDALAAQGVRFPTAVSEVPLTLPAHSSLLTGLYPFATGVRDNLGYVLRQEHVTLAEVLSKTGYATGAFVGAFVLDSKWGLDQGFDFYDDDLRTGNGEGPVSPTSSSPSVERPGALVAESALMWLSSQAGRPVFCWIHLFDPHDPYQPPEPFRSRYLKDPYAGEVAYADHVVGTILDSLRAQGRFENSLIVLVGDHGEALGQHGESTHGFFLYDPTILVPLIMKLPRRLETNGGASIPGTVQLVDVVPTVLQVAGVSPPAGLQGRGLLSTILGKRPLESRSAYSETYYPNEFGWSELKSWRTPSYKFVLAPRPELYDLGKDPQEMADISGSETAWASRLRNELLAFEERFRDSSSPVSARSAISVEDLERLRSLGYVGLSERPAAHAEPLSLPDPKDRVKEYTAISRGMTLMARGDYRSAVPELENLIRQDSNILSAYSMLGQCYLELGNYRSAETALRRVVDQEPDRVYPRLHLAQTLFRLQRLEESEELLLGVVAQDPQSFQAFQLLGLIYSDLGRDAEAIRNFTSAVAIREEPGAYQMLGMLYTKTGRPKEAAEALEKALRFQEDAMTHLYLANAYMLQGLERKANQELEKAFALDPTLRQRIGR